MSDFVLNLESKEQFLINKSAKALLTRQAASCARKQKQLELKIAWDEKTPEAQAEILAFEAWVHRRDGSLPPEAPF